MFRSSDVNNKGELGLKGVILLFKSLSNEEISEEDLRQLVLDYFPQLEKADGKLDKETFKKVAIEKGLLKTNA